MWAWYEVIALSGIGSSAMGISIVPERAGQGHRNDTSPIQVHSKATQTGANSDDEGREDIPAVVPPASPGGRDRLLRQPLSILDPHPGQCRALGPGRAGAARSEERRVGKEWRRGG